MFIASVLAFIITELCSVLPAFRFILRAFSFIASVLAFVIAELCSVFTSVLVLSIGYSLYSAILRSGFMLAICSGTVNT